MKSYWIVAVAISLAWPSGSKACVGMDQSQGDSTPVQQQRQTSSPAVNQPAPAAAQNKSSYLLVELSKDLKAKKLKPGDKVKAEVSQDVIAHGKVIIPVETKLIGHVTEVSVRGEGSPESRLGIVFDKILLKHYRDVDFEAVVQAVAAPAPKRSRVDEPSQMLPPSMMMGDLHQSSPGPVGRGTGGSSGRSSTPPPQSTAMSESNSSVTLQAPMTVKQSPSTHTETGGSAAQLKTAGINSKPISVGTPRGVTGLKGLSLTEGTTASTPGPVIVSNVDNVKLESGTQILLRVLKVQMPTEAKK